MLTVLRVAFSVCSCLNSHIIDLRQRRKAAKECSEWFSSVSAVVETNETVLEESRETSEHFSSSGPLLKEKTLIPFKWARIHVLYEAQVQEPPLASQQEELEAGTDELQELASSRRDLSGLTEPLAESTLVYSLRRVRRDVKVDQHSPAAQMLQSATYLDEVADLLNAEKPHHGYNNAAYDTTALSGPAPPATMTMHLDSSVLQTSQSYFPGGQSVPLEMNGFGTIDWWQTDMDNFSQPILSYDDLIRFNQVF